MRTVVMLSWEYPPEFVGGLARHVSAVARELAAQGERVHVLTRATPGLPAVTIDEGVSVHRISPYFQEPRDFRLWVSHLNFGLLEAGVRLLQTLEGRLILHAHDWLVTHAAKGLKSLFQAPLVATIHATEHGRQHGIHDDGQQYINDIEWWLTYEAWRVIVCSEAMRSEVRQLFQLSDDKLDVIPNGVHLPALAGERGTDRLTFAAPDERLLVLIGRIVPEKGGGVLIEALRLLVRRHRVRLVIGGVGPYRGELERLAAERGLQSRVHFAGWLEDHAAQALLRHADVAVVPSTYEPFGIVALEAMATGAPVVVSAVGGLAEIVEHEKTGLLATAGDPDALARAIDRLLSDPDLARRLGAAGRNKVTQRYVWPSIAKATSACYSRVLAEHARTPWGISPTLGAVPPASGPLPGRYAT